MPKDIQWVDMEIAPEWGTDHFLFVGATGSGKTTLINVLMKSVFESNRRFRAMVYDPKQEVLPTLYSMLGESAEAAKTKESKVKVLHPFDARCSSWNLAEDIDGTVSARQLATILVPDAGGQAADAFFNSAVRDLLTGVLLVLIKCVPNPKAWTFRDVMLAMLYEPYLHYLLNIEHTREGEAFPIVMRLRRSYLQGDPRTNNNIRASINAKLAIYEPIAATWSLADKEGRTFSLADWVKDTNTDVLVLGNDEASRAALDAINQAIFKRATELLLAKQEAERAAKKEGQNQTWFFLDEVREAGELDGLSRLMTKGRSKGACVVLGFQDIDGMRAVYGEEVAHEICGQCNHIGILRLNSPSTAEWAVNLFGKRLARSQSSSRSLNTEGGLETGRSFGEDERPYVFTSELLYLPQTSPKTGLSGYFKSPNINPEQHELFAHLDWSLIDPLLPEQLDVPSVVDVEPFVKFDDIPSTVSRAASLRRHPAEHDLEVWNEKDWERLGFEGPFRDLLREDEEKQQAQRAAAADELKFRIEERAWRRQDREKQEKRPSKALAPNDEHPEDKPKARSLLQKLRQKQRGESNP